MERATPILLLLFALLGGAVSVLALTWPHAVHAGGGLDPPTPTVTPTLGWRGGTPAAALARPAAYHRALQPEVLAGAVAFLDLDADGAADLLELHARTWLDAEREDASTLRIWRGSGAGRLTDVTLGSGLEPPRRALAVAVADFDGDGHLDLFLGCVGRNRLLRGLGELRFEDVTDEAGVGGDPRDWTTGGAWVDYDGDGDLDLAVANLCRFEGEIPSARSATVDLADLPPAHPMLFENVGGTFTDISGAAGVRLLAHSVPLPCCRVTSVLATDLNDDGWTDLFLSNLGGEDRVLVNRGGRFEEAALAGLGMDAHGNLTQSLSACTVTPAITTGQRARSLLVVGRAEWMPLGVFQNVLPPNDELPLGVYEDTGELLLEDPNLSPGGVCAASFRLRRTPDLLVLAGYLDRPERNPPSALGELVHLQVVAPEEQVRLERVTIDTPELPLRSRFLAHADLDLDGDLDLYCASARGSGRLLINQLHDPTLPDAALPWLSVRLRGPAPNTAAIGARVTVVTGEIAQTRTLESGGSPAQSELALTFGLEQASADRVVIRWPDGHEETIRDVAAGQVLVLTR